MMNFEKVGQIFDYIDLLIVVIRLIEVVENELADEGDSVDIGCNEP